MEWRREGHQYSAYRVSNDNLDVGAGVSDNSHKAGYFDLRQVKLQVEKNIMREMEWESTTFTENSGVVLSDGG